MNHEEFVPGQRWISNTESELGLGIITHNENRRIEVSFPAAGEQRTYAINNAPLSRVIYAVGQTISNHEGEQFEVLERMEHNGCFIYQCHDMDGQVAILPELELDSFVHFSKPQDRLFAGQIDKNKTFELRIESLGHQHRHQQSGISGLLGPRVQALPHQFYIASQVANRHAPRVLLADEVGLGKTVEAGLILHQQLITERAQRALIVVPDSLIHQWLVEMLRRFNLMFTILDEARCQALEMSEQDIDLDMLEDDILPELSPVNPFETTQLALCSLSFLTANPERRQQAEAAGWDLMIVDEAHHLSWSEQQPSAEYRTVEALAANTEGLLLLTATPEQLGLEGHFARLRLLDPSRYFDLQHFIDEASQYRPVSELLEQLQREDAAEQVASGALDSSLDNYLGSELRQSLQQQLSSGVQSTDVLDTAIDQLLDRQGTGRVLFRNTRAAISGFPIRQLNRHQLASPDGYAAAAEAPLEAQLKPEQLLGANWLAEDSRVAWLAEWVGKHRYHKTLVICADAETAVELEDHLRLRHGVRSAVFHEGMSLVNRDRAAAYFADPEDSAQLLICSEIGSEGRNFQFASHLVLFDLPLNPDLLEQRIGRLDRIGQSQDIQIHVPYYENSAQQWLLEWYQQGCNAFEHSCAVGQTLFGEFGEPLVEALSSGDTTTLDTLIEATATKRTELEQQLHDGRDRLLEINSCHPRKSEQVIEQLEEAEQSEVLAGYLERLCDYFGVDLQNYGSESITLHPGDHMRTHHFPGLPEEGLTGTWDRQQALSRDDMHFLTWEHPLVSGGMDMLLNAEYGNNTLCTIKLPPLKEGTLLLEAIFVPHCAAPKWLQMGRYYQHGSHRLLLDSNGNDLSAVIGPGHLSKLAQRVPKRNAQNLVKHVRDDIEKLIERAESQAQAQCPKLIETAQQQIEQHMSTEIDRLSELSKVNANIRQAELQALTAERDALQQYAASLQLKLEALRVIIVTG